MSIYPSGTLINNRYEVVQGPNEKPSLAGGMGLIYLCVDHAEDGKPLALKTFRPELLSDRAARDRFLREGTTWVELGKHPHIVHCYQVFKANVGLEVFFALELVAAAEGKRDASLRSWLIPNEPLPLEQALLFALHICRGMVHAENKIPGLVHRDLKPENILIGRDERARVTDFGLASAAQNLASDWQLDGDKSSSHIRTRLTHGIAGTPLYMAPEQWKCETLDERTDIYSFGCILYEMVCGSFVVTGRSIKELERAHCQGQLNPIPTSVPSVLIGLLHRCLVRATVDRYHNWTEVENDLTNIYSNISGKSDSEILSQEKDSPVDRIAVGWSYNAIGISYLDIGKLDMAHNYFEKILTIAKHENDRALEAVAFSNMGTVNLLLGNLHQAIEFHKKCLAIAHEENDCHREAQALGNIGNVYFNLGDFHKSIEFNEKCLAIYQEINDYYGEGITLSNIGSAYFQLGNPHRAIEFHKLHLAIACKIGDRRGEGKGLGNMANAYYLLGDFHRALEFNEKCLAIYYEIADHQGVGQTLGNMGSVYFQLGDTSRAIEFNEQRLAIAREMGDIVGVAETCLNMALLNQHDNPTKALDHARKAHRLFAQMGHAPYAAKAQALIDKIRG